MTKLETIAPCMKSTALTAFTYRNKLKRAKARLFKQEAGMMSDVEKYIERRKNSNPEFAEDFESGYSSFNIGLLLAQARVEAGMTQEELARQLNLNKSTIVRIENHAEDVGIFTLERYAKALGKKLFVEIR